MDMTPMPITNSAPLVGSKVYVAVHQGLAGPALLRKMHEAKITDAAAVTALGTGAVLREFLHSDDMADACVFLMTLPEEVFNSIGHSESQAPLLNIGFGEDQHICELAELIRDVVGFKGTLAFYASKPEGTPHKLLDVSRSKELGRQTGIPLRQGLAAFYAENSATNHAAQTAPPDRNLVCGNGERQI
jgi:GDP-L-fucose synthase